MKIRLAGVSYYHPEGDEITIDVTILVTPQERARIDRAIIVWLAVVESYGWFVSRHTSKKDGQTILGVEVRKKQWGPLATNLAAANGLLSVLLEKLQNTQEVEQ